MTLMPGGRPGSNSPRRVQRVHPTERTKPLAVSLPLFEEYEKKEKCGLFGVWGSRDAAQVVYQGLFAQQHRGQESAGIVAANDGQLNGHAGMGLVSQVFNPRMLREELAGAAAIGHVSYST